MTENTMDVNAPGERQMDYLHKWNSATGRWNFPTPSLGRKILLEYQFGLELYNFIECQERCSGITHSLTGTPISGPRSRWGFPCKAARHTRTHGDGCREVAYVTESFFLSHVCLLLS